MNLNFKNAKIFTSNFKFNLGGFSVSEGFFDKVLSNSHENGEDLNGALVIPGLVDIHNHGNSDVDFTNCNSQDDIIKATRYLARNGSTSLLFTTGSDYESILEESYRQAKIFMDNTPDDCAYLHGVHMEGVFFSQARRGAHPIRYLREPDYDMFNRLNEASGSNIRIVCVSAELNNSISFINRCKHEARVSIAHSNADYETAVTAFASGANHVTHMFNGMSPFLHREPGVVGAALDSPEVMVELISDGLHVHQCVIRAVFRMFSAERVILVSDNVSFCGLPDGKYGEGDEAITVSGKLITLPDGTVAGSGTCLFDGIKKVVSFGIPIEDVIRCATYNPALAIGVLDTTGTIENGKSADFIVCNENLNIQAVYIKGNRVV